HLARQAIDEGDAAGFVRSVVRVDVTDDGVGDHVAVAGVLRVCDGGERTAEIGEGAATPLARTAIVASGAAVVRRGKDRGAADRDGAAEFGLGAFAEKDFTATHFHRRQKLAVRQHLVAFGGAGGADVFFEDVVKTSDIGVGDGPVIAVAIATGGFEVVVAHAVALASPYE